MIVDSAVYEDGRRHAGALALEDTYEAARREHAFAWIGLYEPTEEEFASVRREFKLHELAIEDAIKAHQRPKAELYGDWLFVVLKTVRYDEVSDVVELGEILVFLGRDFLVTVRHGETALHEVRLGLEARPDLLRLGPAAGLHAILDRVVDDYQPAIDGLDRDIREVEEEVFSASKVNPAERIYSLKREVLKLHEALGPLPEALERLLASHLEVIPDAMRPYLRDVLDHALRAEQQVEAFRDLLTSVLTANLTQITVRQNEDVRRISAWAAIIAVPTAIAGVYGMNFTHMPELDWEFGYPLVVGVMAAACLGLYAYFRRTGWL